jgi:hypothetical protein
MPLRLKRRKVCSNRMRMDFSLYRSHEDSRRMARLQVLLLPPGFPGAKARHGWGNYNRYSFTN